MKVYSFATPSIISENIAEKCRDHRFITSIILNTDIVSRIGVQSLQRFGLTTANTDQNSLCPAGKILWIVPTKKEENRRQLATVLCSTFSILWPLSKFGIKITSEKEVYGKDSWKIRDVKQVPTNQFSTIIVDGFESLYAHFPHRYAWALGLNRQLKIIKDTQNPSNN
eukprot:9820_1